MRILDNLIFRAEELDEVKIQYRLAVIYQTGDRTEQNLEQARHWFERAAENGHEDAARILATMGGKPVKPKTPKEKKRSDPAEAKSAVETLPPVIQPTPRQESWDLGSDSEGTKDCPHGHGPLQDWQGNLHCWICGWTNKQAETKADTPTRRIRPQPELRAEAMGGSLGSKIAGWFGNKPRAVPPPAEKPEKAEDEEEEKEGKLGFDTFWVIGGAVYLLTRSC